MSRQTPPPSSHSHAPSDFKLFTTSPVPRTRASNDKKKMPIAVGEERADKHTSRLKIKEKKRIAGKEIDVTSMTHWWLHIKNMLSFLTFAVVVCLFLFLC